MSRYIGNPSLVSGSERNGTIESDPGASHGYETALLWYLSTLC